MNDLTTPEGKRLSKESSGCMSNRRISQICTAIVLGVAWLAFPQTGQGKGDQYSASESDIQMNVDYRWAGGSIGGYYPVRISLQNRGLSRELELTFKPLHSSRVPTVTRRISVDQNASATLTFLIPLAGHGNFGRLTVSHNGRELEKLQNTLALPDPAPQNSRPALLGISQKPLAIQPLEDAITTVTGAGASSYSPVYGRSYGGGASSDNQTIEPYRLPETWLAYSCVDLVAISLEDLRDLPDTQRAAILDWVRAGGTLLVFSVGESVSGSSELAKLTEADSQSAGVTWVEANPDLLRIVPSRQTDEHGNPVGIPINDLNGLMEGLIDVDSLTEMPLNQASIETALKSIVETAENAQKIEAIRQLARKDPNAVTWPKESTTFESRKIGHGRLVGFVDDPFSGTARDWGWFIRSFSIHDLLQAHRLGVAGRMDNAEFLEFLIPGIRSVPVMAFLIFISVFTFVIGPLNYFVLARKKKLNFLVVSIPALAIVTSVFLFIYSSMSHGFSVKSRVRSLTVIDQGNNKAVTTTRLALYAGMTPSDGLSFSPSTAVMPIRANGEVFESARTDWTETQWLRSGWLRSRTRTQFLTRNVRPERGRLTVAAGTESELPVTNGFEWGIESLVVVDQDGKVWSGNDLAAGSGRSLKPIDDSSRLEFCKLMDRSAPANPEDLGQISDVRSLSTSGFLPRRSRYHTSDFHVSLGQMERFLSIVKRQIERAETSEMSVPGSHSNSLHPNTYYAIMKDAPSIEFGTEVDVIDGWHFVTGSY